MKKLDEQELARYCSQGDTMAQDELYRRYAARLETLCRRFDSRRLANTRAVARRWRMVPLDPLVPT